MLQYLTLGLVVTASSLLVGIGVVADPRLAAVAAALPFAALLVVGYPAIAVLSYVALRPVVDSFVYVEIGPLSAGQLWGAGLVALMLVYLFLSPRPAARASGSFAVPVLLLLLYLVLTLGRSSVGDAPLDAVKLASWLLLAYTAQRIASDVRGQRWVIRAGFAAAVLIGIVMVRAAIEGRYGDTYYEVGRLTADDSIQGPHGLAYFAVLVLPFVMLPIIASRRQFAAWVVLGLLSTGIVLSLVRTAIFGLALILSALLLFGIARRRAPVVTACFLGIAAAAGTALLYYEAVESRFEHGGGRLSYWNAVLNGTLTDPLAILIGKGADTSTQLIFNELGSMTWAHNDFLDFFATGGLVLLGGYLALLMWALASAWRLWRDPRQSSAARDVGALGLITCAAFIVLSFFNGILFGPATVALALLIGLIRGMCATPGQTWLDTARQERFAAAPTPLAHNPPPQRA